MCSVDSCEQTVIARGYCRKHYNRWWRHGDPTLGAREPKTTLSYKVPDDPSVLAYMAGLVDGEGTIRVSEFGRTKNALVIGMTDREVLDWVESRFGGRVRSFQPGQARRKEVFYWGCYSLKALGQIFPRIIPYMNLTTKIDKAEYILGRYSEQYPALPDTRLRGQREARERTGAPA